MYIEPRWRLPTVPILLHSVPHELKKVVHKKKHATNWTDSIGRMLWNNNPFDTVVYITKW